MAFTRCNRRSDRRRDRSHVRLHEATVGAIIGAIDSATGRGDRLPRTIAPCKHGPISTLYMLHMMRIAARCVPV